MEGPPQIWSERFFIEGLPESICHSMRFINGRTKVRFFTNWRVRRRHEPSYNLVRVMQTVQDTSTGQKIDAGIVGAEDALQMVLRRMGQGRWPRPCRPCCDHPPFSRSCQYGTSSRCLHCCRSHPYRPWRQSTMHLSANSASWESSNDAEPSTNATDTRKCDQLARGEPTDTSKTSTINFTEFIPSTLPTTRQKPDFSQASFGCCCHFRIARLTYENPVKPTACYHAND